MTHLHGLTSRTRGATIEAEFTKELAMMIETLDPAGQVQKALDLQCTPIPALAGKRVAILDNTKPNFQRLAQMMADRLRDDFDIADIQYFRKENPAVGAGAVLLDQIAGSADLVFTGSAD